MFEKGKVYTRQEMSAAVGDGLRDFLSHKDGRVIAVCMVRDLNPDAPYVLGTKRDAHNIRTFHSLPKQGR